jgi:molecular chaperone HscB
MNIDINKLDYFEILQISPEVQLDLDLLERKYLELQNKLHPDRFLDVKQKHDALILSDIINKAFIVIKDDLQRRQYLLKKQGVLVNSDEDNVKLDNEFLEEVFFQRMELENLNDLNQLNFLLLKYIKELDSVYAMHDLYYKENEFFKAGYQLLRAKYYSKIIEELNNKIGKNR